MRKFADQRIEWKGKTYTIPANRIMPLLARVESIITFTEMLEFHQRKTIPQAKVATAYAEILRYCGIEVDEGDVYLAMFPSEEDPNGNYMKAGSDAVQGLMKLMLPPDNITKAVASGNAVAPATSGASSKKRTRRQ